MGGQPQLTIIEWIDWYHNARLHGQIGDIPPTDKHGQYQVADDIEIKKGEPNTSKGGPIASTPVLWSDPLCTGVRDGHRVTSPRISLLRRHMTKEC
jgi:hypothetical protein